MSLRVSRIDAGFGVSFIASAVIHLAVFLLLVWWGRLFPPRMAIQETYYVDIVTLPVANPQSGSPAQAEAAPPAPAPPMTAPPSKTITNAVKRAAPRESAETESAFNERMAKLERAGEARREEAVLEKLRSKLKAGVPGAGGTEAGSRYADYVKSRLEDALKITSSYTTKNPEVAVRLTIGADGRLLRMMIERSSGDATFELAVRRAIDLASEKFPATPNRTVFENGFIFRPKGISNGTSR
ncbi:MAG TPA: TonB family protein [Dongiaceae bacterium]|nr:TonB family protein [Dongiaceae bacterium]